MAASAKPSKYVIYRPEELRCSDIVSHLVFRSSLAGSNLVDCNQDTKENVNTNGVNLITVLTWILQKVLIWLSSPIALLGAVIEFTLNLFALNGGILGLLFHFITGSLVIPNNKESVDYKSILALIDGRTNLHKLSTISLPRMESLQVLNEINPLDLCIMASKIAYENRAYIENVVTNNWKMHFVGHYQFWNDTQSFICCDRREDAQLIVVAFRGTEPFNARDWATDIDLSWMTMGEMGRVHVGFMNALGLQDETDYIKGWPKHYVGSKNLAYYSLRKTLKELLHENKKARILVTGHSLGGALAILFPALLAMHKEDDIMCKLWSVFTFGQPRVGDKVFGKFMRSQLNATFRRYYRVIFRYDVVPRVPFDDSISQFAHFGGCVYYGSWYSCAVKKREPNMNYFNPLYMPSKYLNAWLDVFRALFAGIRPGKDFAETWVSFICRAAGLVIPGAASHSPRDYLNGARLSKLMVTAEDEDEDEDEDDDEEKEKEKERNGF